jgi:hypothetical protein
MVVKMKTREDMMIIGDTITNRYVSFTAGDFEILEIYNQIKSFYNPRVSHDSAFSDEIEKMEEEEEGTFANESMSEWFMADNELLGISGDSNNNKKKVSKSRFYIASPNVSN